MSKDRLTDLQERFCLEYLKDLNASAAAARAGYSEATAGEQGYQLLQKPWVLERVKELKAAQSQRIQVDADQVLGELQRLGYSDLRGLYNDDGTIKHPKDWPDEVALAVSSIEVEETFEGHGENRVWTGYTKKVRLWSKEKALELLSKHKKLLTDKVEHSGTVTLEALVAGSQKKEIPE